MERPNPPIFSRLKQLDIVRYRGTRGGHARVRRAWDTNQGVNANNLRTLPQAISTVLQENDNQTMNTLTITEIIDKGPKNNSNIIKIQCEPGNAAQMQTYMKICCINPRSVKSKTLSLFDYILSNNFDIVAVTET